MCVWQRLGKYGTGASVGTMEKLHGVSSGSVENFTWRVIKALNNLAGQAVQQGKSVMPNDECSRPRASLDALDS